MEEPDHQADPSPRGEREIADYQRRSQIVKAVLWDGTATQMLEITRLDPSDFDEDELRDGQPVCIESDDGAGWLNPGEWIVTEPGPFGRIYGFTVAEFEDRYEPATTRTSPQLSEGRHEAHIRQIAEAVTGFYNAVLDWTGHDADPPQTVLDASKAIQRLTDPELYLQLYAPSDPDSRALAEDTDDPA